MNQPASRLIHGQRVYAVSSEKMTPIDDESIDVIVTSPPYNRGKFYSGDNEAAHNDRLHDEDYHALLGRVFAECRRVLRDDGLFFLNIGDAASDQGKSEQVAETAVRAGFQRIQTLIWVKSLLGKGHYTPSGRNRRLNNCWEYVYLLARSPPLPPRPPGHRHPVRGQIQHRPVREKPIYGTRATSGWSPTPGPRATPSRRGHDAPFPLELPWRCIRLVPGACTVLDPFGGTMSTLARGASPGTPGHWLRSLSPLVGHRAVHCRRRAFRTAAHPADSGAGTEHGYLAGPRAATGR